MCGKAPPAFAACLGVSCRNNANWPLGPNLVLRMLRDAVFAVRRTLAETTPIHTHRHIHVFIHTSIHQALRVARLTTRTGPRILSDSEARPRPPIH